MPCLPAPAELSRNTRIRLAVLVLFAGAMAVPGADIASLEKEQIANRERVTVVQHERADAWNALQTGPLKGVNDDALTRLNEAFQRLDVEARARNEALKMVKEADEIAALKIEAGELRRQRDAAETARTARILALAATAPGGAELAARVKAKDAELAQLQADWASRRGRIGELQRAQQSINPQPRNPVVILLEAPEPPDAATRRQSFAERNEPAALAALGRDFFRLIDPAVTGVAAACSLETRGKHAEALAAYRDYFFAKVASPEQFGIAEEAFTDDSRQFMSERRPPEAWIADAMNGIANATSHDLGDEYVVRATLGPPGTVPWAYVADQPALKNGKSVWLEFQRRLLRAVGNDGGYEGLRDTLLDAYALTGEARYLERWADYTDDWYLAAQKSMDASPHNLRWADPIIPRLVCGFVSRMRYLAQRQPDIARQMPPATLARILIRLQEEYLAPNILVARTTRQNWNMMGLGFNVRNALLLPEFLPAQWAGREAKRGLDNAYLFSILPDGGVIEYGDEGHQGVWRERMGGVFQLLEKERPVWATPAWESEIRDTFNQNVRFWIRHLKPDGYQHRDGLRDAREVYVGGVQSVFGPQSLNTQAPWVCAEPEAERMLEAVFGPFEVPLSGGTDAQKIPAEAGTTGVARTSGGETSFVVPPLGGTSARKTPAEAGTTNGPQHLSDVSPFIGEIILRGAWNSNAPFFYMQGARMPNSGCFDDATAFRVHDFGQNLLIASPLTVDGRWQNAHFGMVDNVGSKSEYLAYNDGGLSLGRWHSSSNFDFAECFYAGAYENKTGRQYRTTFQPGGNSLRLKNLGEPAITNVRVARQVFFVRDPACWIVVDRIQSPANHRYQQSYDLFTPVAKLEWYRRAKTPIPNAANRVVFDAAKQTIRTENPGFPNVTLHQFASVPLHYEFDKDWHELDQKTKGEIAIAEEEWSKNRPELRDVMAFSRRVNVSLEAEGEATLVTLIEPRAKRPPTDDADHADGLERNSPTQFTKTLANGATIEFSAAGTRLRVKLPDGRSWTAGPDFDGPIQPVTFGPATNVFTDFVEVTMTCPTPGVEIRYTLDASDPTPQSPVYTKPVRLEQSARVKAIALRTGLKEIPWQLEPGLVTIPTWAVFTRQPLESSLQAVRADTLKRGLQQGLAWEYCEGNQFALVANSPWWPAKKSGTTTNLFDVSMRESGGAFGVRYAGLLTVPADGVYTFHAPREFVMPDIEAGYDLRIFVDGHEWEPALRRHALGDWSIALAKGAHAFRAIFVDTRSRPLKYETWRDWPNPAVLWSGVAPVLEVSGPGVPRQPLPSAWLQTPATNDLRAEFLQKARPAVASLLLDTERRIGAPVTFEALPDKDEVAARSIYDTSSHTAKVMLRRGWEDVEVAHELMHTRMDVLDGFAVLAWRRGVDRTKELSAAFGRLQTYVKDEVVHARLAELGLAVDREILRPPLFDSLYANATRFLDEGRDRANDGLAHLDKAGYGTLARVCFLMQAERVLEQYRSQLPQDRIAKAEGFIRALRKRYPDVAARSDEVLALFRAYDVMTPAGQREILVRWAALEGLDKAVGPSVYQRAADGAYTLPFPE